MDTYFDPERLAELQQVMGAEGATIIASMLEGMVGAVQDLEAALADGDLDRATQAAHRCRNDALMVGAKPLQQALTELETATRGQNESQARKALEAVRAVWPATREQLTEAARPA